MVTRSADETRQLAAALAAELVPGDVLALLGDLGSGKTCFVQGLAQGLDCAGPVTSPTFTLINEYPGRLRVYHADLYRLHGPDEAQAAGLEECMQGAGITVIEWADRARVLWPERTIEIRFQPGAAEQDREILVRWPGRGQGLV